MSRSFPMDCYAIDEFVRLPLTPEEIAFIRSGLRKLGPERCQQALWAFTQPAGSWQTCLLARAYGPPTTLFDALLRIDSVNAVGAAHLLGLTHLEASSIIDAFDAPSTRLWLETEVRAVAAVAQPKVLA